jgi:hypothetical protein
MTAYRSRWSMKKRSIAFSAGRFMGTFACTKSFLQIDKRPIGIIYLARSRILSGGLRLIYSLKPFVLRCIRTISHPASSGDIKASAKMRIFSCICARKVSGMTAIFGNWAHLKARFRSYDSIEPGYSSDRTSKGAEAEDPLIFRRASHMQESHIKSFSRKLSVSDNPLILEDRKTGPIAADDYIEISSQGPYLRQRPMRSSIDLLGEDLVQTPEPSFMEPRNADLSDAYGVRPISLPWRNSRPPSGSVPHSAAKKSEAAQERIRSTKSNIGQEASLGEEIVSKLNIVNASLDRFISRRSLLSGEVKMAIGDVAGMSATATIFCGVHRDLRFIGAGREGVESANNSERSDFPALVHSMPSNMNQPDNSSRYASADGPDSPSMASAIMQPHKAKIREGQASFVYREDLHGPREAPNEIDLSSLAERVYTIIERKTKIEMERRGLYSRS